MQTRQLRFLHILWIRFRPGGTPEISRWWNHRDSDLKFSSPGGAADRDWSVALSGLGCSTGLVPVVAPPANFHCASGAKTFIETLASQFALRFPRCSYPNRAFTKGLTEKGEPA